MTKVWIWLQWVDPLIATSTVKACQVSLAECCELREDSHKALTGYKVVLAEQGIRHHISSGLKKVKMGQENDNVF